MINFKKANCNSNELENIDDIRANKLKNRSKVSFSFSINNNGTIDHTIAKKYQR